VLQASGVARALYTTPLGAPGLLHCRQRACAARQRRNAPTLLQGTSCAGHSFARCAARVSAAPCQAHARPGAPPACKQATTRLGHDAVACCAASAAGTALPHDAQCMQRGAARQIWRVATSAAACVPPSGAVRLRGSACRLLRERSSSRGLGASTLPCARVRHLCRRHFRRGVGGFSAADSRSMAERGGPASASAGRGDPGGAAVPAEPKAAAAGAPATRTAAAPAASEAAAHFGTGALPQAHRWRPRQRCNALRSPRPSLRKI
jgi:hypothetical protein